MGLFMANGYVYSWEIDITDIVSNLCVFYYKHSESSLLSLLWYTIFTIMDHDYVENSN